MLAGKTILVVEDEPVIALLLEDLLLDGGARPIFAATLVEGEAKVRSETIEAALLDVNIHGKQSYPLARILRDRGVPFIFASGYGATVHAAEFAAVPTIAKPYNLSDIERALSQAADALAAGG